jgi:RNA polymerase sigma-70 factor (ECF subfamily)
LLVPPSVLSAHLLLRPIVPACFGCKLAVAMIEEPVHQTMNSADQFEAIVSEHYEALYRFALSLTRADAEARDLTQHTFYVWATKGHQLRDLTKVKTWLYTTLHRAFLQGRRRQSRFPQQQLDESIERLPAVAPVQADQVDALQVLPALAQLNEKFRAAVALFYLEDYAYNEIAVILEVPVGTVKSRIARGIAQLREILSDGFCGSTPASAAAQCGSLVPAPVWNTSALCESHVCHGRV